MIIKSSVCAGRMVRFYCDTEYVRVPDTEIAICQVTGQWSKVVPACLLPGCQVTVFLLIILNILSHGLLTELTAAAAPQLSRRKNRNYISPHCPGLANEGQESQTKCVESHLTSPHLTSGQNECVDTTVIPPA